MFVSNTNICGVPMWHHIYPCDLELTGEYGGVLFSMGIPTALVKQAPRSMDLLLIWYACATWRTFLYRHIYLFRSFFSQWMIITTYLRNIMNSHALWPLFVWLRSLYYIKMSCIYTVCLFYLDSSSESVFIFTPPVDKFTFTPSLGLFTLDRHYNIFTQCKYAGLATIDFCDMQGWGQFLFLTFNWRPRRICDLFQCISSR